LRQKRTRGLIASAGFSLSFPWRLGNVLPYSQWSRGFIKGFGRPNGNVGQTLERARGGRGLKTGLMNKYEVRCWVRPDFDELFKKPGY
jgi:hypothetical protein